MEPRPSWCTVPRLTSLALQPDLTELSMLATELGQFGTCHSI